LKFPAIAQNGTSRDSRAAMPARGATGALNEQQVLLAALPPSVSQKRIVLAVVLVLLAAF